MSEPGADERPHEQPLVRVVREDEVDVGVVHRRVAAERVVADVERVVRAPVDREPGLERRVEEGRRDLADAAADAALELAVDDHRRLLEALRRVALAGRLVEREPRAGRDQGAVDQLGDELDVVEPARRAAVGRRVRADDARDPHRLRLRRRALGLGGRRRPASPPGGLGEDRPLDRRARDASTSSARPGCAGTTSMPPEHDPERRVARARGRRSVASRGEPASAPPGRRSRPAWRRRSEGRGAGRSASAGAGSGSGPTREGHGRGERRAGDRRRRGELLRR